jgi:hypothetical protein
MPEAFWIDQEYDNQGDGRSRYLSYINIKKDFFDSCWDWDEVPAAQFAATAWRIATGPVMAPGYIRFHPRILSAALGRSDWDGRLLACVDLATAPPQALASSSEWGGGHRWRGWPSKSLRGREAYSYPGGDDLAKDPYILSSVSLRFTVPNARVPAPPAARPRVAVLQHYAQNAVAVLVAELSRTISPVIAKLEQS